MDRRSFVRKSIILGAATGTLVGLGKVTPVFAGASSTRKGNFDLVAVRGENIVAVFERAMSEMGGMGRWVRRGQTVVVKPNIAFDVPPERAANTNPLLVGAVVRHCLRAGASRVIVFDHTVDHWERAYANSGIQQAVIDAGGQMVPGNFEASYVDVTIPGGRRLNTAKVHRQIIDADVFINVPVLKHHGGTQVTIAMKNLMGIVWDRRFWHRNDLHQCIADFCLYRVPDLNIVDAFLVMTQNGPRGVSTADLVRKNSVLISQDAVAVDAASTLLFGKEPDQIGHIRLGGEMNIGTVDLSGLRIQRINMAS